MKINQLAAGEALASVHSSPAGLASGEALRRLKEFGPNVVERAAPVSVAKILVRDFGHMFAVVLWLSAGLAFLAEWNDPGQGMARVGCAVVAVILVSGAFSFWQERRVESTLAALRRLLPRNITAVRDGETVETPVESLVPGDVVLLEQGDRVPADCRLIEGYGVRVDTSTITGESVPRARSAGPCSEEEAARGRNILLAGTSLVSGEGRAVVFATGMETEFGRIAHLSMTAGMEDSPLRRELSHLSRVVVILALAIGASFFAAGALAGMPLWRDVIFSIGIFVAMVPEGLLPTLTLALVLAAQRMAGRNVLIRHLPSVETLGSTTVICTDKTGTLTENRMRVAEAAFGGEPPRPLPDASGVRREAWKKEFFRAAVLCRSLASPSAHGGEPSGDPLETALAEMALRFYPEIETPPLMGEIAFDSRTMRQSVALRAEDGPVLYCKGALETVLPLCDSCMTASGPEGMGDALRTAIESSESAMAEKGLRVLAMAMRTLPGQVAREGLEGLENGLTFLGLAGLEDPPRPEVPEAVARCREAGIKVIMLTGDHPRTAAALALAIGLAGPAGPRVFTGEELRRMSGAQLQLALDAPEVLFARLGAAQKMRIVSALKRKGHVVAVTGDGVNDAPALKSAHIGVAMGRSGADVAREAADMVLLDDNFASIVNAVEEGRAIFQNIRKFLTYVLVHNVAELVPYLAFALFRIPLPLTPIQMLAVDMGTDTLTALGLGAEPPEPGVMRQPPRPAGERLLNRPLALRAYLFLGLMEAAAVLGAFFAVLEAGGWAYPGQLAQDDPLYLQATTASLGAIIVMQMANVFLCRGDVRPAWSWPLGGNPLILWGVVLEAALLVFFVYCGWGNALLGTAPLPGWFWIFLMPFPFAMAALEEGRKWLVRRKRDRT